MSETKVIAFYLPQYHPIPENDDWWGKGFTDWRNVAKGKARFWGHYQPHIPGDLGFYDLRLEDTRIAQAELAREYGITGFCYYHYWFNGRMLLEKPFDEVLQSGKPDFPFCICWANENWTRRWDGQENEILIRQNYDEYDVEAHFNWLEKAFADKRYIVIDQKPLLLIYNIDKIPDIKSVAGKLREEAKKRGFHDLFLCSVKSVHSKMTNPQILDSGFDAIIDFIPNGQEDLPLKLLSVPRHFVARLFNKIVSVLKLESWIKKRPVSFIYSYRDLMNKKIRNIGKEKGVYPCVIPSWDNSARKEVAHVFQNNDADLYKVWLDKTFESMNIFPPSEQIIFINAWNEWAEGCHLEPDIKNGRKFLEATLQVVKKWETK